MTAEITARALIVTGDRRLLLTRRAERDYWVPPGGHLEPGEDLPACVVREALEEAGVAVRVDRLMYLWEVRAPSGGRRVVEAFFLARPLGDLGDLRPWIGDAGPAGGRRELRLFAREDLAPLRVYPEVLRDAFWEALDGRGPADPYLGVRRAER